MRRKRTNPLLNDAAVRMDSLLNETVVGKSMDEVYKSESDMPLLLPKVLKAEKPYLNQRQQYETFNGKEVDIVSDNYPIFKNSQGPRRVQRHGRLQSA